MSFKVKDFNHPPQWYYEHNKGGDDASPAARKMLKIDMAFIDAEYDQKMCYEERVQVYEEAWNEVMSGKKQSAYVADLQRVLEEEGRYGRPQDDYVKGSFLSIARIMEKNGLAAEDVRKFLTWRSKNENMAKARAGIEKKETKWEKMKREKVERENLLLGEKGGNPATDDF
jgi:hypothetical protein